jgi:8-oxo-dGTP pyrophosphatase MutT (NUDIX family)
MDVFTLLDEIRVIAQNGLYYSSYGYDHERYEHLMSLVTQQYSDLLQVPDAKVKARFLRDIGQITPKIGADAAVFDTRGKILLMERSDGSGLCLPCGWVEQYEKPIDAAIREALEETGLKVKVKCLVGVFTRQPSARNGPIAMIDVVHLCEVLSGELKLSHEGLALTYRPIEEVEKWHAIHRQLAIAAYETWKSGCLLQAISD